MSGRMLTPLKRHWMLALGVSCLLVVVPVHTWAQSRPTQPTSTQPTSAPANGTGTIASTIARLLAKPGAAHTAEAPSVRVRSDDRVEIHVADVPLSTVLRMLAGQSRMNIVAGPNVKGTVTADLYDVTLTEALDSILRANNCGFEQRGNFVYVYTLEELAQMQAYRAEDPMTTRLFRLNYVSVKDLQPLIQPLLSREGKIAVTPESKTGLETKSLDAGGNSMSGPDAMMVYDHLSCIDKIAKVIQEIDVRPKQVLIEATILRAGLNDENSLGIDFNIVSGVDFEMLGSTSPGVQSLQTGNVPQAELNNTDMTIRTDFNDAVPPGGLTFGIIKDQVAVFLRALETVTDTTVLANPKILALNKQRGHVIVGRQDGYLTTTVTETTAVQTVEFLETGTQLIFRPFIGDDGYVRMELHPEDSTGALNASNLPFKATTEVNTNILVRDGNTILIGGLFRETTTAGRGQVPILGNIPVLGALFRATNDTTNREEVIILLTVHIIKDDAQYAKLGEELSEDAMRIWVGARRGLQAFGRNRLSLAYYHKALENLKAGNEDKALWDTRMSLHLVSSYLPAIKLKERLLGKHSCEYRAGTIRSLINRRLMGQTATEDIGPPAPGSDRSRPVAPDWGVPDRELYRMDDPQEKEGLPQ